MIKGICHVKYSVKKNSLDKYQIFVTINGIYHVKYNKDLLKARPYLHSLQQQLILFSDRERVRDLWSRNLYVHLRAGLIHKFTIHSKSLKSNTSILSKRDKNIVDTTISWRTLQLHGAHYNFTADTTSSRRTLQLHGGHYNFTADTTTTRRTLQLHGGHYNIGHGHDS